METSTSPRLTPRTARRPESGTNLWEQLNTEWDQLCTRPSADAEAIAWTASQPALAHLTKLADLTALHRADRADPTRCCWPCSSCISRAATSPDAACCNSCSEN